MKYFDQHVHNYYSRDSKETIINYILKAKELGLDTIEFTNHVDLDEEHKTGWVADFDKENIELNEFRKKYPEMTFYQGVEIAYCSEDFDQVKQIVDSHDFNVVNFSMHWWKWVDFYIIERFEKLGYRKTLELYFEAIIEMINEYNNYDVLTHIDYAFKTVKKNNADATIKDYEPYLITIFSTIIKNNKALEINTKCQSGINDINHVKYLLTLYKSLGGKYITLSSDAHSANRLCEGFNKYIHIIKECGFNYLTVFIKRKPILIPIEDINFKN